MAGGAWTLGTNWSTGSPPNANDDITINPTATFTITAIPTITINTLTIGLGTAGSTVSLQSAAARTITIIDGASATDFSVAAGLTLILGSNVTIDATAASSIGTISGNLKVLTGAFTTTTAISTFVSGSSYTHARNGGTIPAATYNSGSTLNVTGVVGTIVTLPQTIGGDVVWNCTGQTVTGNIINTSPTTISGKLTVTTTNTVGGGGICLGSGAVKILNVGGDFQMDGGAFILANGTKNETLNITGDFKLNGGTFDLSSAASVGGNATVAVSGNVTITSGTIDMQLGTGTSSFSVSKDWTNNGTTFNGNTSTVTFNGTIAQAIGGSTSTGFNSLTISNTSAAVSANTNFSASGTLTVNASAILSPAAACAAAGSRTDQ